jgi:hypothetical protein
VSTNYGIPLSSLSARQQHRVAQNAAKSESIPVIGHELYRTSVIGLLLRCLRRDEGKELLAQTHSGVCEGHTGSRALVAKGFRRGFYWPLIIDAASKLVTTCEACQKLSPTSKAPSQPS